MYKIDLDQVLTNLEGKPYIETGKNITIGKVLVSCLDTSTLAGKMKMFILAKRCAEGGTASFSAEDLALLKQVVESSNLPSNVVVGQTLIALDVDDGEINIAE